MDNTIVVVVVQTILMDMFVFVFLCVVWSCRKRRFPLWSMNHEVVSVFVFYYNMVVCVDIRVCVLYVYAMHVKKLFLVIHSCTRSYLLKSSKIMSLLYFSWFSAKLLWSQYFSFHFLGDSMHLVDYMSFLLISLVL